MKLSKGATVAVADGEKLLLFRNGGDETSVSLNALPDPHVSDDNKGAGVRHQSSSANPNDSRLEEDSFAAATAAWLNKQVLEGKIDSLVVIAAPKTLGELRKHYHQKLQAVLQGELAKDLTGRSTQEIAEALAHA